MTDTAADAITQALLTHRPSSNAHVNLRVGPVPNSCTCGAIQLAWGDRWESHLADVTVAALTQAGILGTQPVTYRTDVLPEARWRAAALQVVAAWTHQPIAGVDVSGVQQEDLDARWPTLGAAIRRLVHAKAELLREKP